MATNAGKVGIRAGLFGLALILGISGFGGRSEAASTPLCPPPPIVGGVINAIPLPLTDLTCALGAADIEILTTFKKANGTLVERRFRTLVAIPTLVNVDDDILSDITVWPQILGLDSFRLVIDRMPLELATLPLKVEIVVNDPTGGALPRERIHGGYDSLMSAAPNRYRADIQLGARPNGDTTVSVTSTVTPKTAGKPLAVLGGLFDGDSLDRRDPLGGRGLYSPVPATSNITLGIGAQYQVSLSTTAPTVLDADFELVDGTTEQRGTVHIDKLPPSLVLDYVPGATDNQRTVTWTSSAKVDALDLTYRQTEAAEQTLGAVVHATKVPTSVIIQQTGEKAGTVETDGAFGQLEVGMANGEPVLMPPAADVGPYVKLFSGADFNSVAVRVDGLKRASVDATDDIVADVEVTVAGRKPIVLDIDDPAQSIDGTIVRLPEHLTLTADLAGPVITYDGHGQGLDDIRIDATSAEPFFERATEIHAHAAGLAALFTFALEQIHVEPFPGLVVDKGVEVTSSAPIELVEFEATNGTGSALPVPYNEPETGDTYDTGAVYEDTPSRYAIGARVHGFERLLFNRHIDETITLGTTTAAQPLSLTATLDDAAVLGDRMTADGLVWVLPHQLDLQFRAPSVTTDGLVDVVASAAIGEVEVTIDKTTPFLDRPDGADPHIATIRVKDIPAQLHADVTATADGAAVVLDHAIGMVEALITSGPGINLGGFGEASGVAMRVTADEFVALGRLHNVTELRYTADPLAVELHATEPQGFLVDITVDDPDDLIAEPGHITGEIAQIPTDLTITKGFGYFEWLANEGVAGDSAVTLLATNLPSGPLGALNDGGVHFVELEIDDLPAHFRINAGGTPVGVEAFDGGSFGRIFVQVSDAPASLLGDRDPETPRNEVLIESADATEDIPGTFVAFLRLYDLQLGNHYFYADYLKSFDIVFADPNPPAIYVDVDTTLADVHADIFEPPQWLNLALDTEDDTLIDWTASADTDVNVRFALHDTIAADLEIANIPTETHFCVSTAEMGCESEFEQPHGTDSGCCLYTIPSVFHTFLRTTGETEPIVMNGLLCLKPSYTDLLPGDDPLPPPPAWSPVCDFEGGDLGGDVANSWHRVRFTDVAVTDLQIDLVSGESTTPDVEDDLLGGYMDFPSFSGRVTYWNNVLDEPESLDHHSRVTFESIGDEPFSANDWEFLVDVGSTPSQIYAGGDNDCGSDSMLELWVATQFSDVFELDDLTPEVDLCTD